jgi:mRNA interferase HigB
MRIIAISRLRQYAGKYPTARSSLEKFRTLAEAVRWRSFADLKQTYNHADQCVAGSGRKLQIINVQKNKFRLIVHIHFDKERIYIREFLTHAEYSKGYWKDKN